MKTVQQEWNASMKEQRRAAAGFLRAMGFPVPSQVPDNALAEYTINATFTWEEEIRLGDQTRLVK